MQISTLHLPVSYYIYIYSAAIAETHRDYEDNARE
jgi:hypothetical protein